MHNSGHVQGKCPHISTTNQKVLLSQASAHESHLLLIFLKCPYSNIYKFEISTKFDDKKEELENYFKENNIPYKRFWYYYENNKQDEAGETKYHEFDIYAFTKEHSKRITRMLDKYDRSEVKYVKINTSNYKES